ncbi:MAG: cupin domain-containing protein [Clostridia bacterium]|nr:cupin domain-containing protein [Clostridia bacterium]
MIVSHLDLVEKIVMSGDAVKDASMKKLVGPEEGWDSHVMRVIELGKDGYSPKHVHPWPHINYIIEGEGVLFLEGKENPIKAGSFAYVPSGELHQFRNTGDVTLKFICIVPKEGHL